VVRFAERVLYPEKGDYLKAVEWQIGLRKLGTPVPVIEYAIEIRSRVSVQLSVSAFL